MNNFLIIQTAFVGDAILVTALLEKLHQYYPKARMDVLVRKGNETLFEQHPFITNTLVWHKKSGKYSSLLGLVLKVRETKYDCVINVQRFFNAGLIAAFSGSKQRIGFDKNPWSFTFSTKIKHQINNGMHEVDRNQLLIAAFTDKIAGKPKLYTQHTDGSVQNLKQLPYVCIAPASVWFTKQWPAEKWIALCNKITAPVIYLIGSPADTTLCEKIKTTSLHSGIVNMAGKLSLLQSASLLCNAQMNYVNDSAPMHLCSATNAPVTAVYCSTVPAFGFGPLSNQNKIAQINELLPCRPCGLHGYNKCPEKHFNCANNIHVTDVL
jgi:heptosyltransferase-2